jgi:hypothetical protein
MIEKEQNDDHLTTAISSAGESAKIKNGEQI